MNERLYYSDSYTRLFRAQVVERLKVGGQPACVLDQTYFYPTSGGQPADHGHINSVAVVDVSVREQDGAVVHVLDAALAAADREVEAEIDWSRRFDHMQHHSGQHVLSQAFLRAAAAETVGFHLGAQRVSIDVEAASFASDMIDSAESLANEIVVANLPVRAWVPSPAELATLDLRTTPDVDGGLRVVAVGEFDYSACGGTHVARTGEIGVIKIIKVERHRGRQRVEFLCGSRALADYGQKNAIVNKLAADLTCGYWELEQSVARLRSDVKATGRALRQARQALIEYEAVGLLAAAPEREGVRVIRRVWAERDPGELRDLALRLTQTPGIAALLGTAGEKARVVLARADDVDRDMTVILRGALQILASEQGGGQPKLAQGGGVKADLELVTRALAQAEVDLLS